MSSDAMQSPAVGNSNQEGSFASLSPASADPTPFLRAIEKRERNKQKGVPNWQKGRIGGMVATVTTR